MDPRDSVPLPLWLILSVLIACAVMVGQAANDPRSIIPTDRVVYVPAAAAAPACPGTGAADPAPTYPLPEGPLGDPWSVDPPGVQAGRTDVVLADGPVRLLGDDLVRPRHRQERVPQVHARVQRAR